MVVPSPAPHGVGGLKFQSVRGADARQQSHPLRGGWIEMRMCRWAATMRKRPAAYGEAQNRVITHKPPPSGLKEGVVFWGYSGGAVGGEGLLFFAGNGLNKRV